MTTTPPGFTDFQTHGHVLYGCKVVVPFAKCREVADAAFHTDGDIQWAALPGGDTTSTTGYNADQNVSMAVGVVVATAGQGFEQGEPGFPYSVTLDSLKGASNAWEAGVGHLSERLQAFDLSLGAPSTFLVATGPLSMAMLEIGDDDMKYSEDIEEVAIDQDAKLSCQYD